MTDVRQELIAVTQKLLNSIAVGDWETYSRLCHPTLTCFEPEGRGHLIEGLPFHKFYFDLGPAKKAPENTICSAHVRVCGEVGVISYTRLTQVLDEGGKPITKLAEETRVWQKLEGSWRQVHFHRSLPST
jgi:calcium/calmodulin-dependent protein kinase (CaM kinase) II